jgi:hypothetical protein
VLASACKAVKLDAARLALQMPAINPQAVESAHAFMARLTDFSVSDCVDLWSCKPQLAGLTFTYQTTPGK